MTVTRPTLSQLLSFEQHEVCRSRDFETLSDELFQNFKASKIDELFVVQNRRATDLKAPKKGSSGKVVFVEFSYFCSN